MTILFLQLTNQIIKLILHLLIFQTPNILFAFNCKDNFTLIDHLK
jgi:hypothetical protein